MASTSIKSKILLLLLGLTLVVVISMAVLMQLGFKQGFTAYKQSLVNDLNDRMVAALEQHYAEQGSWQNFVEDPRMWHELIFESATDRNHSNQRSRPRPANNRFNDRPPRKGSDDLNRGRQQGPAADRPKNRPNHRPPPKGQPPKRQPLRNPELSRVLPSYSLYDAQQQLLLGNQQWDSPDTTQIPLQQAEQVVGYIVYDQTQDPNRQQDQQFYATFIKLLVMIASVMILVVLLFTVPVARYFTRPIKQLNQATQQAAGGDYAVKLNTNRKDELGQLAQNFNILSSTLASNAEVQKKMMADIAHDLRTPVAVLQAQIEALQDGIHKPDAKNLTLLHQQTEALGRLISDLHHLSVADLGSMQYQMQAVDLHTVIQAVEDAQQLKLKEKSLTYQRSGLTNEPMLVLGDASRLQQMWMNLYDNAIAYTDSPGKIQMQLTEDAKNQAYVLCLSDSAPGLLPHEMNRVFDRLYRQESSRNRNSGGSGLGLAIVKNIVDAHHGSITASASELGGLSMTVRIPKHA